MRAASACAGAVQVDIGGADNAKVGVPQTARVKIDAERRGAALELVDIKGLRAGISPEKALNASTTAAATAAHLARSRYMEFLLCRRGPPMVRLVSKIRPAWQSAQMDTSAVTLCKVVSSNTVCSGPTPSCAQTDVLDTITCSSSGTPFPGKHNSCSALFPS